MLAEADADAWGDEAGLLTRLRRRKAIVACVFISVILAAVAAYVIVPATYLPTGEVMLTSAGGQMMGEDVSPAAEQKLGDPADIDGQILVLKSTRLLRGMLSLPAVQQAVHEDCQAGQGESFSFKVKAMIGKAKACDVVLAGSGAMDRLQDAFVVGAAGRSRVIQISYQSASPQAAVTLVNSLIDGFLAQGAAEKQQSLAQTEAWVQSQLDTISRDLRGSELQLEQFRKDHGLVRGQNASIASERLSSVSQQLAIAEASAADAAAKLTQARGGAGDLRETLDSRSVSDLKQQMSEVSGQLATMTSTHGPQYPGLMALQQERDGLRRSIGAETGLVRSSLERDYASATAQVASLQKQLDDLKSEVSVSDLSEAQIASKERDNDIKRQMYVDLSKKATEIEAQRRLVTGDAQLVAYAELPDKVYSPKLILFILAGTIMATVLAIGAAVLRDRTDTTIRTSGRLEALTGVRVLGAIPRMRSPAKTIEVMRNGTLQLSQSSDLQEAIRALYTRLMVLPGAASPRTLLLASAGGGEGKSFLTLAIAQFAAAAGKRILVIEGDLRHPGFRTTLSLTEAPGLAAALKSEIAFTDAIQKSGLGFDVIGAGKATVGSTELLSNGMLPGFLSWAKDHYDLVLVDSPPGETLMDAQVLASQVDAVLYCACWGRSSSESVAQGIRSLRQAGGNVVGVVFEMVTLSEYNQSEPVKLSRELYLAGAS